MAEELTSEFHATLDADALLAVLKEAQDTVRSYDTKAEICGVGFILAFGIVKQAGDHIPIPVEWAPLYVLVGWLVAVVPIIMFAMVLYPSRVDKVAEGMRPDNVEAAMYFDSRRFPDLKSYALAAQKSDWALEIIFETMKVSAIRDIKRTRFLRALFWAAGSFSLLFLSQMMRAGGVFH